MSAIESASILAVGSASPAASFEQHEIARFFRVQPASPEYRFFSASHVRRRQLAVDHAPAHLDETPQSLYLRHREASVRLSVAAISKCLASAGVDVTSVSHLCCVTSTGLLLPSLSALLISEMRMSSRVRRADLVGMGCSAAINGLGVVSAWARASEQAMCLLVCCEVNSAFYVTDDSSENAVVNSLFGDGAAAVLVTGAGQRNSRATVLGFESELAPRYASMLRYEWSTSDGRLRFRLDRGVPRVLGQLVGAPVSRLLAKIGVTRDEVAHWIVHGGGRAILDQVELTLQLPTDAIESAIEVLRENGNLGSASVLVCLDSVMNKEAFDGTGIGILLAMGPGLSIECAALRFLPPNSAPMTDLDVATNEAANA